MNCYHCGTIRVTGSKECGECGQPFSFDRKLRQILVPGTYLQRMRLFHFIAIGGLGPLGLLSLTDTDVFTAMVRFGVLGSGFYFLALLLGRIVGLRNATPANRLRACFDALEISTMALLISMVEGFWWGFSATALNRYSDITALHLELSMYAGAITSICFFFGAFLTLVTVAEISHVGVGEFRDNGASGNSSESNPNG